MKIHSGTFVCQQEQTLVIRSTYGKILHVYVPDTMTKIAQYQVETRTIYYRQVKGGLALAQMPETRHPGRSTTFKEGDRVQLIVAHSAGVGRIDFIVKSSLYMIVRLDAPLRIRSRLTAWDRWHLVNEGDGIYRSLFDDVVLVQLVAEPNAALSTVHQT